MLKNRPNLPLYNEEYNKKKINVILHKLIKQSILKQCHIDTQKNNSSLTQNQIDHNCKKLSKKSHENYQTIKDTHK